MGLSLPQSAKKIREVKNEKFDIYIGFWETRSYWYYWIKVADISGIVRTRKKDRIVQQPTPIDEDYLTFIEDVAKKKTAICQPDRLEMLKWLSQFRYV